MLATPIGLALPEPDKAVKKFNLLPPEVASANQDEADPRADAAGSVGVLVLLALFGGWKFYQVHNAQNNVNALQSNIATLNAQVPKYDLVVAPTTPTRPASTDGTRCSTRPSTGRWRSAT